MINIVLYDDKSIIRIAKKVKKYFSNYKFLQVTKDTIWLQGVYFWFCPRIITVNVFNSKFFSWDKIYDCLKYALYGEEVFVFDNSKNKKYINFVNSSTNLDIIFTN